MAQIASKDVGVTDRYQRTSSGSHRFNAVDILAEHERLRSRLSPGYDVRLAYGPEVFGRAATGGRQLWYTFVTDDFGSKANAASFCDATFSELGRNARANQCLARRLRTR